MLPTAKPTAGLHLLAFGFNCPEARVPAEHPQRLACLCEELDSTYYAPATKNSDAPHHHARSDEHRLGFHRRSGASLRSGFHGDGFRERDPGGRQSPLGDSRGVPFSSRHASADAEDRLFHHSVPSSGVHKVAQPPRRPHSRHDFRDFLQPSYHKMSPSAVQSSDNCANIVGAQVGGSAVVTQRSKKDLPGNNFNQEFPTLQGADEAPVQQPPVVNGSVWGECYWCGQDKGKV
ncbi:uncharacterized protein LOC119405724 [Rhipicephalus sanguineus]|uniref:uncharacterized protein LOC119405724 n=1 Tax=Rhipicephalus sanguineus TaxID=34632 RepID=UPI0020C4AB9B|nr:uncharacterized protein LOC119405724 [Rhipicephalus sanguineus]